MNNSCEIKETLCWDCVNAGTGQCEWSKNLMPVPGWTAEMTNDETGWGCLVIKCPKFIRDADEAGAVRLSERQLMKRTSLEDEEEIPDIFAS